MASRRTRLLLAVAALALAVSAVSATTQQSSSGGSRKLFGVFTYQERTLASSGYQNYDNLGCGVFTNPYRASEYIKFFLDPSNAIGEIKIDVVPLFKGFDANIQNYDWIVGNATAAGIAVNFMESNLVPGDDCANNCADTCSAKAGTPEDSCTPSYMDYFHNMVTTLLKRWPSTPLGAVYDLEQGTMGDFSPVWQQLSQKISAFEQQATSIHGSSWTGYSIVRPAIYNYTGGADLFAGASTVNFMHYFSPLDANWDAATGEVLGPNGIVDQVKFCKSSGRNCRVQIGFETSAEDPACKTYQRCKLSFVWGAGLSASTSIIDWIEGTLEPALTNAGIDIANDLADVPYFLEHQASAMAYFANVKKGNIFPATQCYIADPDCITCCPNQKHKALCGGR